MFPVCEQKHRYLTVEALAASWIEIRDVVFITPAALSKPLRLRGLKSYDVYKYMYATKSKPLRLRGLKSYGYTIEDIWVESKPLRLRGLKSV